MRAAHCLAGVRRHRELQAAQAIRRLQHVVANPRQRQVCDSVKDQELCPVLCQRLGGCILPLHGDHPSECKRKVFRAERVMDALVEYRQFGVLP